MTTLFIANFSTQMDLDAERDDPTVREIGLADFAAPQVASVSLTGSEDWVLSLKAAVENDVTPLYEDGCPELVWADSDWQAPTRAGGRWSRILTDTFLGGDYDEAVASIVIQQVEAE